MLIIGILTPNCRSNTHTLIAEKWYSINFTKEKTKLSLNLHYIGAIVICLLMVEKLLSLKQMILKLLHLHCVYKAFQNTKHWSIDNMKKFRLKGYVYDFSVDYDT